MTIPPVRGPWGLLRPLLFRLDAEQAHDLTLGLAARWSALFAGRLAAGHPARAAGLRVRTMGLDFPNPVGLAAGLDKGAVAVPLWQRLGFGFCEVGTITAHRQPGNPRPRLFRLPADGALVNRMGFNNAGCDLIAARLARLRARGVLEIPLGVNLGKSKVTPAEGAAADYRQSFERLAPFADYVVVNISSPNTPGLRDLQRVDEVSRIIDALQGPNQRRAQPLPLLLKLAPDLADADALDCAHAALAAGCAGLVLTNTTIRYDGLTSPLPPPPAGQPDGPLGGLSGAPLTTRSTALLRLVREAIGPGPTLIGVGGIMTPADAVARLAAGADLIQLYTGLIYQGPGLVGRVLSGLEAGRSTDRR